MVSSSDCACRIEANQGKDAKKQRRQGFTWECAFNWNQSTRRRKEAKLRDVHPRTRLCQLKRKMSLIIPIGGAVSTCGCA